MSTFTIDSDNNHHGARRTPGRRRRIAIVFNREETGQTRRGMAAFIVRDRTLLSAGPVMALRLHSPVTSVRRMSWCDSGLVA